MISVIVPIYNVAPYLEQCIQSICDQTYQDLEIILVDDGSTDACPQICEDYCKKDARIKVIHKANGGLVSARKAGLQAASGTFISWVDGDDWVEPDMYARMYQKAVDESVDMVICGHYEDAGTVRKKFFHRFSAGRYAKAAVLADIYPKMMAGADFFEWELFLSVWGKLFYREKFAEFQFHIDERITVGEDVACIVPCLLNIDSLYIMRECLYHYRQTPASMIKRVQDKKIEQERFQILYQSVQTSLERYTVCHNLQEQWRQFYLFLAIPRADNLYQGFSELEYLFPFPYVKRGSDIILYCAGTYGQRLYTYLKKTCFCRVVLWVDRNYKQLQSMGIPVESPERLAEFSGCDSIVVANMFKHARRSLYQELSEKYPQKRIYLIDEDLIFSGETLRALGLQK